MYATAGQRCRSDQPFSLEAKGYSALWDAEGSTWYDGAWAKWSWKNNLYTYTDESYDRWDILKPITVGQKWVFS